MQDTLFSHASLAVSPWDSGNQVRAASASTWKASSYWLLGISVLPKWVWHHGTHRVIVSSVCHCLFSPWTDLDFLQVRVPLEQVSRHVVTKDASRTGWGAVCNRQAARLAGQDVADFTDLSRAAIDTVTQA